VSVDLTVPSLDELHERRSEKWSPWPRGVVSSTIAEMDFPLAAPVAAALHAAVDRHDLGYAPSQPRGLVEAFAGFARRRLHWDVDPEQVRIVPDVMVGLLELCRVLLRRGEGVAFATPAYPPFIGEFEQAADVVEQLPHAETGTTDLGAIERSFARGVRAVVLASPHNPTGRVLPRDELAAIAALCAAHGAFVLVDEIHGPLTLAGARHVPWLEVSDDARACGIVLTSASKAFNLAGLKTALVVTASGRAADALARMPSFSDRAGLLGVVAGEAAFREGDEWLDAVLAQLDENRALLGRVLADELPRVRWTPPDATYLAWLDCRALRLGDDPARAFLERGRVALSRGLDYGAAGAGHVRLNFGTSPALVAEAMRRMAAVTAGTTPAPTPA
jgi:cystathionine beta-lyase